MNKEIATKPLRMALILLAMGMLTGCPSQEEIEQFVEEVAEELPADNSESDSNNDQGAVGEPCSSCPLPWSDPATWGGAVPAAGDDVTIRSHRHIVLDVDTPALGGLNINGRLDFDRQDVSLTADWIMLHGELHIGSEAEPFTHQAIITLTGDDPNESVMDMGTRGIMVMGGVLELHGNSPDTLWARINQSAAAGSNQLHMEVSPDWQQGDQVVVAPTDWYGASETEDFELTAVDDAILSLDGNLQTSRWGDLQYVTSQGISLTPDGSVTPPAEPTPLVLDERAVVGNLSRNVVIQGADDALWQQAGFGAHLMIMNLSSQIHVQGVEFRRVGQAGVLGRYPWHWHMLSYAADGSERGDVDGHIFRNNSIHQSANRCITIHGTNGTVVQTNICYDISGHGVFFEDAVERRNIVENNLILKVRSPAPDMALKVHEIRGGDTGASGIWVSNPDNTVRGNHTADTDGFGIWMAFPESPVGLSANVDIRPNRLPFGNFDDNITHSNRGQGIMFDLPEFDNDGNVRPLQYASTSDGEDYSYPFDTLQRITIRGIQTWKNGEGGFWNRVVWPSYIEWVSADNEGRFFAGSGADGVITRSLVIGESLNNATPRPNPWVGDNAAFATYHSAFDMRENVVVNFPLGEGNRSGLFAMDDYYIRAVDKGQIRNPNNHLINTHPGYRSRADFDYYTLAGALWDPHGLWGPAGNYFVYDEPFLTHGAECEDVSPSSDQSGGISCDGEFYSVSNFVLNLANSEHNDLMAIEVTRFDEGQTTTEVGEWRVESAQDGAGLDHMRHFAARHDGVYLLEFPDESSVPQDVAFEIQNARHEENSFVLGVAFDGNEPAQVFGSTFQHGYLQEGHANAPDFALKRNYTAVGSRQAVIDSQGWTYYQDVENDIVWIRIAGGLQQQWNESDFGEYDNERLYWPWKVRIW